MALIHSIYASASCPTLQAPGIQAILEASRLNNAACGITGMLLFSTGSFFQVLEGDDAAVDALMARIAVDPRHGRVTLVIREAIARRAFSEWTMGFVSLTAAELQRIGGNDFFDHGTCLAQVSDGRARKLLAAFGAGRWRSRVSDDAVRAHPAA